MLFKQFFLNEVEKHKHIQIQNIVESYTPLLTTLTAKIKKTVNMQIICIYNDLYEH